MSEERNWFWTSDHAADQPDAWGPGLRLRLQRHSEAAAGGKPVLLLHGASACHRSFTVPDVGLADWLADKGFDPWLLDWRGSHLVVDKNAQVLQEHSRVFNFNRAALEDLPAAIREMRDRHRVDDKISLLGHCMGSTVIAEAVASERVTPDDVDSIVLSTLGLFYEAPIDGRLKSEDRVLERLSQPNGGTSVSAVDPRIADGSTGRLRADWPRELDRLYQAWPRALRSHEELAEATDISEAERSARNVSALCNRLSFMYGTPYYHRRLVEAIHGRVAADGQDAVAAQLPHQFGAIPLPMYLNAARNLRAGHALIVDDELTKKYDRRYLVSDDARKPFREFKMTLVTGALNRLWHRDSIDRMHEWLCRGSSAGLARIRKHVFPDYAHQDLWWATDSCKDIYPDVRKALS